MKDREGGIERRDKDKEGARNEGQGKKEREGGEERKRREKEQEGLIEKGRDKDKGREGYSHTER